MDLHFTKVISSALTHIPFLAEEIANWGKENQIDGKHIFQVNLILEELITNIINYGHKKIDHKKIYITLQLDKPNRKLIITLLDEAPEFNPLKQSTSPLDVGIEERIIGGLGIHFVKSLTEHIDYHYTGTGNQLKLYKSI